VIVDCRKKVPKSSVVGYVSGLWLWFPLGVQFYLKSAIVANLEKRLQESLIFVADLVRCSNEPYSANSEISDGDATIDILVRREPVRGNVVTTRTMT
jgi:hypothetical protein